jgi:hypothetical protein
MYSVVAWGVVLGVADYSPTSEYEYMPVDSEQGVHESIARSGQPAFNQILELTPDSSNLLPEFPLKSDPRIFLLCQAVLSARRSIVSLS